MEAERERFTREWEPIRMRGFWRFLFSPVPVVFTLLFGAITYFADPVLYGRDVDISTAVLKAVATGLLFAVLLWLWNERKYRRATTGGA